MIFRIKRKEELPDYLIRIFRFNGLPPEDIDEAIDTVKAFIEQIQDSYIGVEYPYVDKLYRASYYNYYSSKLLHYHKNCLRLSFFSHPTTIHDFFQSNKKNQLENSFLGFLVLRPTPPNLIGRNFFTPAAFCKNDKLFVSTTTIEPTINGRKLKISGFPHCSQDSEMMVCAETTIWSIMEYFSNRYSDYHSILPQDINDILANKSVERQTPSQGLSEYHMSFVLKKLGFGVRMYSSSFTASGYSLQNLYKIVQMYVESGIPVVVIIRNDLIAHSLNIVGRTEFISDEKFSPKKTLLSGSVLYDFYEQKAKYLVIDDNHSPYRQIDLDDPAVNYDGYDEWKKCKIDSVIVPLHREIYLEADRAEELVFRFLENLDEFFPLPTLVVRTFLSSCRSFKNYISDSSIPHSIKRRIVGIDMPKFVYLAEFSLPEEVIQGKASGIMILDATEPQSLNILGFFINNMFLNTFTGDFDINSISLPPFERFNNLQMFDNGAN